MRQKSVTKFVISQNSVVGACFGQESTDGIVKFWTKWFLLSIVCSGSLEDNQAVSKLSILLVTIALLPLLFADAFGASRPSDSAAANAPSRPATPWAFPGLLNRECRPIGGVPTVGGLVVRLYGAPRTAPGRAPDATANCLESKQHAPRATTADFRGMPVWAQRREMHF